MQLLLDRRRLNGITDRILQNLNAMLTETLLLQGSCGLQLPEQIRSNVSKINSWHQADFLSI
jgi:hypothetical protein